MDHDGGTYLQQLPIQEDTGEYMQQSPEIDPRVCDQCKELTTYDTLMKLKSGDKFHHGPLKTLIENSGNLWSDFTKLEEPWLPEVRDPVLSKTRPMSKCWLCWEMVRSVMDGNHGKILLTYDLLLTTITLKMIELRIDNQSEASRVLSFGDIELKLKRGDEFLIRKRLGLVRNRGDHDEVIVPHQPAMNDLASKQVFDLARSWLQTCGDTHHKCKDVDDAPLLPARVIEVASTYDGFTARVIPSAQGQRSRYLCLSYCWGGSQNVTATQASLPSLKQAVPMDKLGLTIRDAIETTSRLGFKYLWVDALCILQDDIKDKMANIQHMAHIYKHATAVISAATAANSNEGFLRTGRISVSEPEGYAFTLRLPSNSTTRLALVAQTDKWLDHPLDKRGWVLQEQLLSCRNMIFSRYEMLIGCRTHGIKSLTKSSHIYPLWSVVHPSLTKVQGMDLGFFMLNWSEIVGTFTRRLLSNPEDRIHAFQGIADEVSNEWKSPVESGVVVGHPKTLGWMASFPTNLDVQRAPSWSWMCHGGPCGVVSCFSNETEMRLRCDDNKRIMIVHARIISGVEEGGHELFSGLVHGGDYDRFYPDSTEPLPQQQDLIFVDLGAERCNHDFLVLVGAGKGVYRRVGLYTMDGGFHTTERVKSDLGGTLREIKLV